MSAEVFSGFLLSLLDLFAQCLELGISCVCIANTLPFLGVQEAWEMPSLLLIPISTVLHTIASSSNSASLLPLYDLFVVFSCLLSYITHSSILSICLITLVLNSLYDLMGSFDWKMHIWGLNLKIASFVMIHPCICNYVMIVIDVKGFKSSVSLLSLAL